MREADLDIHELVGTYATAPVLVIIDVQPQELGLPTSAYTMVEEVALVRLPPPAAMPLASQPGHRTRAGRATRRLPTCPPRLAPSRRRR